MAGGAFVKIALDSAELKKGVQNAQNTLRSFMSSINKWSGQVAMTSVVMTLPFKKALDAFAEFDLKMRQVKAITGESGSAIASLTEQARKLGRATSFTTAEVANAMVILGRIGFTSSEVGASVKAVMNLAKATGSELATAVNVAGNQLRIFGKDVSEIERVADIVTYTVNRSAMSLDDFQEAAAKAGPNFANSAGTIEQMAGSLAILANMGIKSSIAGTAVSRAIKQLADPQVDKMLRSYGIQVRDVGDNLLPLHHALANVARVMAKLPTAKRIRLAEDIFGARGSMAGLPLTMNSAEIDKFIKGFDQISGIAERTATDMDTGMFGALKRLASALNDVYISIGDLTSSTLVDWIESLSKAINRFSTSDGFFIYFTRTSVLALTLVGSFSILVKAISMFGIALGAMFNPLFKLEAMLDMTRKRQEDEAKAMQTAANVKKAADLRMIASEKARTAAELRASAQRNLIRAHEAAHAEREVGRRIAANNSAIASASGKKSSLALEAAPNLNALASNVSNLRSARSEALLARKDLNNQLAVARASGNAGQVANIRAQLAANGALLQTQKEQIRVAMEAHTAARNAVNEQIAQQDVLIANARAANAQLKEQEAQLHRNSVATMRDFRASQAAAQLAVKDAARANASATNAEAAIPASKPTFKEFLSKREAAIAAQRKTQLARQQAEEAQVYAERKAADERYYQNLIAHDRAAFESAQANSIAETNAKQRLLALNEQQIALRERDIQLAMQETEAKVAGINAEIAAQQQLIASLSANRKARRANYPQISQLRSSIDALNSQKQAVLANSEASVHAIEREIAGMRQRSAEHQAYLNQLQRERQIRERVFVKTNEGNQELLHRSRFAAVDSSGNVLRKQQEVTNAIKAERNATIALSGADMKSMEITRRKINVLMKCGGTHLMLAGLSKKHYQEILKLSFADVASAARSAGASKIRVAALMVETAVAKALATAMGLLKASFDLIAAHPIMTALIVLVGYYSLLRKGMDNAAKSAAGNADAAQKQYEEMTKKGEALKENMKAEQESIGYLIELEKQGYATAEQQKAARKIIDELNSKYGEFGITMQEVTGKINGAMNAQKKLNAEQKSSASAQNLDEQGSLQQIVNTQKSALLANSQKNSSFFKNMFLHNNGGVNGKRMDLIKMLGYEWEKDRTAMWLGIDDGKWVNSRMENLYKMNPNELQNYREQVHSAWVAVTSWGSNYSTEAENVKNILDAIDDLIEKRKQLIQLQKEGVEIGKEEAHPEVKNVPNEQDAKSAMQAMEEMAAANRRNAQEQFGQTLDDIRNKRLEYAKNAGTAYRFYENEMKMAQSNMDNYDGVVPVNAVGMNTKLGVYGRGNIDLFDMGAIVDENGDRIVQKGVGIVENGLNVLIPTLVRDLNGEMKELSKEEAIDYYRRTGQYLGKFSTRREMYTYSDELARQQAEYQSNRSNDYVVAQVAALRASENLIRIADAQKQQDMAFDDQIARARENEFFTNGEKELSRQKELDNFGGALKVLTGLINFNAAAWRNATAEYNRTLADARKAGVFNGTATEDVVKAFEERLGGLRKQIEIQRDREIQLRKEYNSSIQTQSAGSFSARALDRLVGRNPVQERIAEATRRTAEYLARITELDRQKLRAQNDFNNALGTV